MVLLVGAAWWWLRPRSDGEAKAAPERPAPVVLSKVTSGPLWMEQPYYAELRAVTDAELTAGEPGRVTKVMVREGDRVRRGDVLLTMDAGLVRAEARRAVAEKAQTAAELEQAKRDAKRFEELGKETVVSTTEVESKVSRAQAMEAERQGKEAQISVMRERLQRHRIVAPFDGVIAKRLVDPGDWLDAGRAALALVTDNRVEVFVRVPPELLDRAGDLSKVDVRVEKNGRSVPVEVVGQVNVLEQTTRTALLRLRTKEAASWLRAGDTVNAVFRVAISGGVVVPRDALVQGVAETRVMKVVDNKAVSVIVKVLAQSGSRALVTAPELALGNAVVTRGNERLRPGQPLAPAPAASALPGTEPSAAPPKASAP